MYRRIVVIDAANSGVFSPNCNFAVRLDYMQESTASEMTVLRVVPVGSLGSDPLF